MICAVDKRCSAQADVHTMVLLVYYWWLPKDIITLLILTAMFVFTHYYTSVISHGQKDEINNNLIFKLVPLIYILILNISFSISDLSMYNKNHSAEPELLSSLNLELTDSQTDSNTNIQVYSNNQNIPIFILL